MAEPADDEIICKMNIFDYLLNIYFRGFLEPIARLFPPRAAYYFLSGTGDKFRNWDTYASGMDEPGILLRAHKNLIDSGVCKESNIHSLIKQILCFESRFVIENMWIKHKNFKRIFKSFYSQDIAALQKLLENRRYIITTTHTACLYLFVALLHVIKHPSVFVIANHDNYTWRYSTALVESSMRMRQIWKTYQGFIFPDSKDVLNQTKNAVSRGNSLILCVDTPGYSQGIKVNLFGKAIAVPAGAFKLSHDCNIPILLAIPYAESVYEPYKIFLKMIESKPDAQMTEIFQDIESIIRINPACWAGWFYMDAMSV